MGDAVENDMQHSYVWRNTLYFRRNVAGTIGQAVDPISLSIDTLWQKSTDIGAFYEPISAPNALWLYGLAGALLLVGTGIALRYRKSTVEITPAVDEQPPVVDLAYPDSLNGQERDVFSALLKTSDADGLNTEQLNDILLIADKSPDNQRKIRADVIKALNLKLQLQWGIEEAVERKATALDRRMYTYIIDPAVKDRIRIKEGGYRHKPIR